MKTQLKIYKVRNNKQQIIDFVSTVGVIDSQSCDGEGNVVLNMSEQLTNEQLSKLENGNVVIITKHFWFSKKQLAARRIINAPDVYCLIDGVERLYSEMSDVSNHTSSWDDILYLGYGTFLR